MRKWPHVFLAMQFVEAVGCSHHLLLEWRSPESCQFRRILTGKYFSRSCLLGVAVAEIRPCMPSGDRRIFGVASFVHWYLSDSHIAHSACGGDDWDAARHREWYHAEWFALTLRNSLQARQRMSPWLSRYKVWHRGVFFHSVWISCYNNLEVHYKGLWIITTRI